MQRVALFLLLVLAVLGESYVVVDELAITDIVAEEWESFKAVYEKKYEDDVEEKIRFKIYLENRHAIATQNRNNSSYQMVINKFGDMQFQEFSAIYHGFQHNDGELTKNLTSTFLPPAHYKAPNSVDWRTEGAVTAVKNQQQCGSCWAFGTTGTLEGQHFRKTGVLVSLSEQDLIDCATTGCKGCGGGNPFGALLSIRDNGGIDTESSYPYEGRDDTCRFSPSNVGATVSGVVQVKSGDEGQLLQAVATVGPIVVAIDATETLMRYSNGVFYDPNCSPVQLNHAVLVVGYGTENGQDYWLVKNSWGSNWGEQGYVKMARGRGNNCGIASYAGYPLV